MHGAPCHGCGDSASVVRRHGTIPAMGTGSHSHHDEGGVAVQRGFALAIAVTFCFAIVEAVAGVWSGSLALLADAGHMLSDVFALGLAWGAASLSRLGSRPGFSYGFRRAEVLAALVNALIMLGIVAWLVVEAWARLQQPRPVVGVAVMAVAAIGLGVNLLVLWILRRASRGGLNSHGAILHVMGDLLGSVAALTAGTVIWLTGWTPIDPLLTLFIAGLLGVAAVRLLRHIAGVLMEAVPAGVDQDAVREALAGEAGIVQVHDLHIWTLAGDRILLTAHLQLAPGSDWSSLLPRLQLLLRDRFGILHATLQAEPHDYVRILAERCALESAPLDDHRH